MGEDRNSEEDDFPAAEQPRMEHFYRPGDFLTEILSVFVGLALTASAALVAPPGLLVWWIAVLGLGVFTVLGIKLALLLMTRIWVDNDEVVSELYFLKWRIRTRARIRWADLSALVLRCRSPLERGRPPADFELRLQGGKARIRADHRLIGIAHLIQMAWHAAQWKHLKFNPDTFQILNALVLARQIHKMEPKKKETPPSTEEDYADEDSEDEI